MKTAAIGITAILIGVALTGCVGSTSSMTTATGNVTAPGDTSTGWDEVAPPLPKLDDSIAGFGGLLMLHEGMDMETLKGTGKLTYGYFPGILSPEVKKKASASLRDAPWPRELVLGEDGVIDLSFIFWDSEVLRTVDRAYVTDKNSSTQGKTKLDCDVRADRSGNPPQTITCNARFTVAGNHGGTFYGVIETSPTDPALAGFGKKRTVAAVTVLPFGSNGTLCGEINGERKCNSLPKK